MVLFFKICNINLLLLNRHFKLSFARIASIDFRVVWRKFSLKLGCLVVLSAQLLLCLDFELVVGLEVFLWKLWELLSERLGEFIDALRFFKLNSFVCLFEFLNLFVDILNYWNKNMGLNQRFNSIITILLQTEIFGFAFSIFG